MLPVWRIHRHIGMGGDQLVAALTDEDTERARGDAASSAKPHEVDHYLGLLDARELADGWTTSADVSVTKPHPDLVCAALERAGASAVEAVTVGDSPWDARAALR